MTIEASEKSRAILENAIKTRQDKNVKTFQRITQDGRLLNDFILNLGNNASIKFEAEEKAVKMIVQNGSTKTFTVHPHALSQIAEKFGLSQGQQTRGFSGYVRTMAESGEDWKLNLAAKMINEHVLNGKRERVLVREVAGQVKGVLSDQYKRMDTLQIFEAFFNAANNQGCQLLDVYQSDLKSYMEVIHPEILQVPYYRNGELSKFDVVFGARIANSDFGAGSLELRNFILQVQCLNGQTGETLLKSVHLGSRLPDDFKYSELTYKRETIAQASKVNDFMTYLMSPAAIRKQALLIEAAVTKEVDYEQEFKTLVKSGKLYKSEVEKVVEILSKNEESDGVDFQGSSLWKLTQGVTAYAKRTEPSRAKELSDIAGELLRKVQTPEMKL